MARTDATRTRQADQRLALKPHLTEIRAPARPDDDLDIGKVATCIGLVWFIVGSMSMFLAILGVVTWINRER